MSQKKTLQLGMHHSKAANRLERDLLFHFAVQAGHKCFRCGKALERADFSVDHKVDWLDSAAPVILFFDIQNIAFSHGSCNKRAGRKGKRLTSEQRAQRSEVRRAYQRRYWHSNAKLRLTDPDIRAKRNAYMKAYLQKRKTGLLAQSAEQLALNQEVPGSLPGRPTRTCV